MMVYMNTHKTVDTQLFFIDVSGLTVNVIETQEFFFVEFTIMCETKADVRNTLRMRRRVSLEVYLRR